MVCSTLLNPPATGCDESHGHNDKEIISELISCHHKCFKLPLQAYVCLRADRSGKRNRFF